MAQTHARPTWVLFGVFVAAKLLIHLVSTLGDTYFRDELYYIACSQHLALGYVDQPPLSIVVVWLIRHLFGDSLLALRLVTAAVGALTIIYTGLLARELGGSRTAQALAMLTSLGCPVYLAINSFFSMNSLEILLWAIAAYLVALLLKRDARRYWVLLGIVIGAGLENKISMLWFAGGLVAGLLLTAHRRRLLTPGPWIAATIAAALFAPHIIWQVTHAWPTLEFMRNAAAVKMVPVSALQFLGNQILVTGPPCLPIWLAGLLFLLLARHTRTVRPLGWIYVAVFAVLAVNGTSRANYLSPAYTMLFAAGAVAVERLSQRRRWAWITQLLFGLVGLGGIITTPIAIPLLPPDSYVAYSRALGVEAPTEERDPRGALPQHLSDRYGWDELVAMVAQAYNNLPAADRAVAGIFVGNYGEAAAIDVLGARYRLPPALSGHNNYWLWGPRGYSGMVMIVLGVPKEALEARFAAVEQVAVTDCRWCRPLENHRPVYVCRNLKQPLADVWPELKVYR